MSRTLKRGEAPAVSPIQELVERVGIEVRRMGAQRVMRSQAIAEQLGMHTTDLECLDLIYLHGRALAGELAQATGLTSGAVTALIDRLETGGYVVREVTRPTGDAGTFASVPRQSSRFKRFTGQCRKR